MMPQDRLLTVDSDRYRTLLNRGSVESSKRMRFYDDLIVFLTSPTCVDPLRLVEIIHEALMKGNVTIEIKEYSHTLLRNLKGAAREYQPESGSVQEKLKNLVLVSRSWAMINDLVTPLILENDEKALQSDQPVDRDSVLLGEEFEKLFTAALEGTANEEETQKQSVALQDQESIQLMESLTDISTRFLTKMGNKTALNGMKAVLRRMGFESDTLTYIKDSPFLSVETELTRT